MKNYSLKIRLTRAEHQQLVARADATGLRISEFARTVLAAEHQALGVENVLARLEARLTETPATPSASSTHLEALVAEVLLLTRELAQDRNAQLLARATQKLNTLYPTRRKL